LVSAPTVSRVEPGRPTPHALFFSHPLAEAVSPVSWNRRFSKETVGECPDVEPRPSNDHRLSIRSHLTHPPYRVPSIPSGTVALSRRDDVDSQVRNPFAFLTSRFRRADIEILVDLPRIRRDDGDR
jgi:hypothetical protein